jgi:dihydroneopterin aldolase
MILVPDRIHIEQLELSARLGVLDEERSRPQRLTVTLRLEPQREFDALSDDITNTIDYFSVCRAAQALCTARPRKLLETLAEEIATELLAQFPIRAVDIELRKYILPDTAFVAVHIHRERPPA